MSETVSVRLPAGVAKKLDALAKTLDRSKTSIVSRAVMEYLKEYDDYHVALWRLKDNDDETLSKRELVKTTGSDEGLSASTLRAHSSQSTGKTAFVETTFPKKLV